jgi:hypothetical protein
MPGDDPNGFALFDKQKGLFRLQYVGHGLCRGIRANHGKSILYFHFVYSMVQYVLYSVDFRLDAGALLFDANLAARVMGAEIIAEIV